MSARRRRPGSASRRRALAAALVLPGAAACELRDITLAEPERVVVAEAYVRLTAEGPQLSVFLHETLDADGRSGPVPGARVVVTRPRDGARIVLGTLGDLSLGTCVITLPLGAGGTCYWAGGFPPARATLAPGDRLALRVELPGGGLLESETTIPGDFGLLGVREDEACVIPPDTATEITWSRSQGAWAYLADTFVSGLDDVFGPAIDDPMYLLGLSVSARDTTIVFPREFGLFSRTELDAEVALALQRGLPEGTEAAVTVAAVDRNWVNWARGGSFNPSGQVRLPSVRGDGTGVFGAAVLRSFRVVAGARPGGGAQAPACPPAG